MNHYEGDFSSYGLGTLTVVDENIVRSHADGPVFVPLETRYRVIAKGDLKLGVPIDPAEKTLTHEPEAIIDEIRFKPGENSSISIQAIGSRIHCDDRTLVFWTPTVQNYGVVEERNGVVGRRITLNRQLSREGVEFQPFISHTQ